MNKTDEALCSPGAYALVGEADNIQINKINNMPGNDKCQKKIKVAKGTESDRGCYLVEDGQGKPLLLM